MSLIFLTQQTFTNDSAKELTVVPFTNNVLLYMDQPMKQTRCMDLHYRASVQIMAIVGQHTPCIIDPRVTVA